MKIIFKNLLNFFLIFFIFVLLSKNIYGNQAYFDLSDSEIEIQTNFNGKEVIIFGLTEPNFDTILTIKGPNQNTTINKKERFFGLWINSKRMIYKDLPSIFFVASSSPIDEILNQDSIIKKSLYFEESLLNLVTQRNFNFNEDNKSKNWNKNLIKIKKNINFFKEYNIKIVDDKLFQTRVFFPPNTVPGDYEINIFQINNKKIISQKNKKIVIKKTGLGNKIFNLAHDKPIFYGIFCIIFAIFSGLFAATVFRRW